MFGKSFIKCGAYYKHLQIVVLTWTFTPSIVLKGRANTLINFHQRLTRYHTENVKIRHSKCWRL